MLISCIMHTRGRPEHVRAALDQFDKQTYQDRELVIVDDVQAPSFASGIHVPGIQYHLIGGHLSIGAKRNLACSRARGEIICHWDDDDWSAPERLETQLMFLLSSGKPVTGFRTMRFTDGSRWWLYRGTMQYAVGTSLMYRRDWWMKHPFKDVSIDEDGMFVKSSVGNIAVTDAGNLMWATIHPKNTSPRVLDTADWVQCA